LDMTQFDYFIGTDPYTAWKDGVRYRHDSENRVVITSMLLMIGYKGTSSLAGKANLLRSSRKICARYSQYDMVPFDTDAELVDVILAVPSTTIRKNTKTTHSGYPMFDFIENAFGCTRD
uniref:Nucleocapsid protein n=1 Tax=Gongylonema pulchrum TaxID=637853 RepID=A0A183DI72_9BILA